VNDDKTVRLVRGTVVRVTTEHGLYILIGVVGFVSAVASLFVDLGAEVAVKWLLGLVCISLVAILILIRALFALGSVRDVSRTIRVIKYLPDKNVFLVRTSFDLSVNSLLSIYVERQGYEELFALGCVENVQDKNVACLRIVREFAEIPEGIDLCKKAVVKTTLPYSKLFEGS
jgi:hypothetical protein